MHELPDKLTFTVEETAEILGVSRNSAYQMVHRGEIPAIHVGRRLFVGRHMLAEFMGLPEEGRASAARGKAATEDPEEEETEWTYVITVKRLKRDERVRVETDRHR